MRRYFLNAARSKNKSNNDFAYKPKGCRSDRRFYPVDCRPKDGKPVLSRRYSRSSGLRPLPVSLLWGIKTYPNRLRGSRRP